ncbi:MAG: hypothetical protein AAF843_19490 [Bacteroidota bacterium]
MKKYGFKIITTGIISAIMASLLSSCFDDPEFADTPRIEFESIAFVKSRSVDESDSLIIAINFEDGDGNLGLNSQGDLEPPFNQRNFFNNKNGQVFDTSRDRYGDLLTLSDRNEIDTLPIYDEFDFPCLIWEVQPSFFYDTTAILEENTVLSEIELNGNFERIPDTVYFKTNERHNNIIVRIFRDENNNGIIEEESEFFDWRKILSSQCTANLDGRFPSGTDGVLNDGNPKEGTIIYNIVLSAISDILTEDKKLKFRLYIYDRAGNRSNVIDTPEVTLDEITIN